MIDGASAVVGSAVSTERIVWIVEQAAHPFSHHQATSQSDRPKGVETIGVLDDLGLFRLGRNSGREAVRPNRVVDAGDAGPGVAGLDEKVSCPVGSERRSTRPIGGALLHEHAVVKPSRGNYDVETCPFDLRELLGCADDTTHMLDSVRGIGAGIVRVALSEKRLEALFPS